MDVITGLIKANFPARISFRVATKVDSRTILDSNGSESLLGKGDMLYLPAGSARLHRIHGPLVTEDEIRRFANSGESRPGEVQRGVAGSAEGRGWQGWQRERRDALRRSGEGGAREVDDDDCTRTR